MDNILLILLFVLVSGMLSSVAGQVIYYTQYRSQADAVLYLTKYKHEVDLILYKTPYKQRADAKKGIYYVTEYKSQAEWKVYWTEYESRADVKVFVTEYRERAERNGYFLSSGQVTGKLFISLVKKADCLLQRCVSNLFPSNLCVVLLRKNEI